MKYIVSINGALSGIKDEFISDENFAGSFSKNSFLDGKILSPENAYYVSFEKLFRDCIWCFLLGDKLKIPNFLYSTIENDLYDGDGQFKMSDYYLSFLEVLKQNNLLEIVDYSNLLNVDTRHRIFENAYDEFYHIITNNLDVIFPATLKKDRYNPAFGYSAVAASIFDSLMHKYFSLYSKVPMIYIDGMSHWNEVLSLDSQIDKTVNQYESLTKLLTLYVPKISFIDKWSDFLEYNFSENIKPIIEILLLLKDSPIQTVIQDKFKFINIGGDENNLSTEEDIILLKEFLKKQKRINKIKRISFIGDKASSISGLFIPFIGVLNFISSNLMNPIIRKYEENNIKKIASKYPSLRHLYFSENEILKTKFE